MAGNIQPTLERIRPSCRVARAAGSSISRLALTPGSDPESASSFLRGASSQRPGHPVRGPWWSAARNWRWPYPPRRTQRARTPGRHVRTQLGHAIFLARSHSAFFEAYCFLFDMNAFFQALLSRFLRENLPGYSVRDEFRLKGMMRYNPKFNPQRRQSPTPRPDYVVTQQGTICSILDAKYRDLWEKQLPREMLYQSVVYAISQRQQPQSSILYPTMNTLAKEARIDVTDPLYGRHVGQVCLRPVLLPLLEQLVTSRTSQARSDRELHARGLALGA